MFTEKGSSLLWVAQIPCADLNLTHFKYVYGEIKMKTVTSLLVLILVTFVCAHFGAPVAIAQTTTATIEGTIKDAQGSVVAGSGRGAWRSEWS